MKEQRDDHIWLTVAGEAWAIQAIRPPIVYLWRGAWPHCEYNAIDMSGFNAETYCDKAVAMIEARLAARRPPRRRAHDEAGP